jgi:SPP1 family predicted phage head-tail adaptor
MRSGKLDRTIIIQTAAAAVDEYGTPTVTWTDLATARAQLIQASTEEFLRGYGEIDALAVIFRTRWLDGVTAAHRVVYEGRNLNIREVKEIGRRRGLELRCEEVRT